MTTDEIKVVIASVSAIIAFGSAIFAFYQAKKTWYVDVIAKQRLEWSENLRQSLFVLITAHNEGKDIQGPKACVELYLSPENDNHKPLIDALNNLCNGSTHNCGSIVLEAQKLLRINWWTVKAESMVSYRYELRRDKKVKNRLERYEADTKTRRSLKTVECTEKAPGDYPEA